MIKIKTVILLFFLSLFTSCLVFDKMELNTSLEVSNDNKYDSISIYFQKYKVIDSSFFKVLDTIINFKSTLTKESYSFIKLSKLKTPNTANANYYATCSNIMSTDTISQEYCYKNEGAFKYKNQTIILSKNIINDSLSPQIFFRTKNIIDFYGIIGYSSFLYSVTFNYTNGNLSELNFYVPEEFIPR